MAIEAITMSGFRTLFFLVTILAAVNGKADDTTQITVDEEKFEQLLTNGSQLIASGNPKDAISYFDQIIAGYETAYKDTSQKLYSARWSVESLMYLAEAAKAQESAVVVSENWAYAYYFKAYSLLELGSLEEAKTLLERAIAMSPRNSQFLSEMGNIHQRQQNWPKALDMFQSAALAAQEFSPAHAKNLELSRAWRGLGYIYVEQGNLDAAEKMYRQCLDLDANDQRASNELRYIEGIRAKQGV
jgi:tetratricopeptide (TPR) repeat protein